MVSCGAPILQCTLSEGKACGLLRTRGTTDGGPCLGDHSLVICADECWVRLNGSLTQLRRGIRCHWRRGAALSPSVFCLLAVPRSGPCLGDHPLVILCG